METFRELQKAAKRETEGAEHRLAVLGNCATHFFSQAVQGSARLRGINLQVFDADYDQIDAQLLDAASEVYAFSPEEILLWLATEQLYEEFLDLAPEARRDFATQVMTRIQNDWNLIAQHSKARVLQMNFAEIDDKALGQFSGKETSTFTYQMRELAFRLQEAAAVNDNVFLIDLHAIQVRLGQEVFFDAARYYTAKLTVSLNALPYVAKAVTDVLCALQGSMKKCIILDLDNTLWGGVIGDDGLGGIEIGDLGKGHVFTDLQRWLKQLKEYGILLAVCSKNDEALAKEPFEQHEEMVLKLNDFSLFVANWEDKASNIQMIQQTLNIGMDAIVFLDDNPFERELVRERCAGVTVPDLPGDPALWLSFLQELNLFETASFAKETSDRTALYQAEFERKKAEASFASIDDYLESLAMTGEARAFEEVRFARIAQLTQRSNQFNLRTVRYTEEDVKRIAADERFVTRYFTLKDKFGDHGLVAVVILEKKSAEELFVDTWLMSCRVLKRGMEEFVMNHIVRAAKEAGTSRITGEYLPTPKNKMVSDLYDRFGFTKTGEHTYTLAVGEYAERETFIKDGDET